MSRGRALLAAALVAGAALTACTSTAGAPAPAEVTARPVVEPDGDLGPNGVAAREAMLDAVHGVAPWLVQR